MAAGPALKERHTRNVLHAAKAARVPVARDNRGESTGSSIFSRTAAMGVWRDRGSAAVSLALPVQPRTCKSHT